MVPCTGPHVYEAIAVRPVPGRFVDSTSAAVAALARRTELARVDAQAPRRARSFQRVMWPGCDQADRVATGVDRFTVGDKKRPAAEGQPAGPRRRSVAEPRAGGDLAGAATLGLQRAVRRPAAEGRRLGPVRPVTSPNAQQVVSTCRQTGNRVPQGMRVDYRFDPSGRTLRMSCVLQAGKDRDRLRGFTGLR